MYKLLSVLVFTALLAFNCSKENTTKTDKPADDKKTTQQDPTKDQNKQVTGSTASFKVSEVDSDVKKNELVDFKWSENGKEMKLSDYKGRSYPAELLGNMVPAVRKELPDLSTISTELKDKDFKMIGVSVDDNQEVLNSFLQTNNLSYTIVYEPEQLVTKYMSAAGQNQNVVPQTYIIDKNGKVVEAIMGSRSKADFLGMIKKYL